MPDIHIFTGPPGSGKSSVLTHLAPDFQTVSEPARRVLADQRATGGRGTGDRDPALFVSLMLRQAIDDQQSLRGVSGPVICDRGLPDLLAYTAYWQLPDGAIREAIAAMPPPEAVFWFPPWQAIYTEDAERTLAFGGSAAFGALVREAYESLGFSLVDVPLAPVEGRAAFIRQRIGV
ncbi:AAA family ATPase [Hyphomonas oceanitis]|uniref:AAA family ATPase n=1 Tax=Hyphomonas oceanitis TaxID=81033 RepID=UPI0030034D0B